MLLLNTPHANTRATSTPPLPLPLPPPLPPPLTHTRWKLLRKVLLRVIAGKLGAGWSKWVEVYKIQRLIEDRATWKRLGVGIYRKTGLGEYAGSVLLRFPTTFYYFLVYCLTFYNCTRAHRSW